MSLQTLIIFVFLTFLLHSEVFCQPCEEADECIAHDGSPGVIKLASDCQKFLQLSRKIRFMKAPCGYSGTTSLVCCPLPKYVNECNKFGIKPQKELEEDELITFKVTNGRMSDVGEFPHFASLGYRKDDDKYSFDCGGALISEKFVLTAAHCCTRSRVPKIVRLGRTAANLEDYEDSSDHTDVEIKEVILYPEYKKSLKYYDIALVLLSHSVEFSSNLWPACLYPELELQNKFLIIAGFGRNNLKDSTKRSNWLMKADAQEIDLNDCRRQYRNVYGRTNVVGLNKGITGDIICAKDKINNADTCEGDSGSALQLRSYEKYYIVGITSFGVSCNTSLPSFYTRVHSYLDWIENIVWKK